MTTFLIKAEPVENDDGELTPKGMQVAEQYAQAWVERAERRLDLEREYPELVGLFYDIRVDVDLAKRHAEPFQKSKSVGDFFDELKEKLQKGVYETHYVPPTFFVTPNE